MDSLTDTLATVMAGYAGHDLIGQSYLTHSDDGNVLTVVWIGEVRGVHFAEAFLIARVVGQHIVIELDNNSKILLDALLQAGMPRDRIVVAYAGETNPHAA